MSVWRVAMLLEPCLPLMRTSRLIAFLVETVCPDSPDADACGPRMTEFWGAVGPVFWPEYSSHICDDREDCAAKNLLPKTTVPACESCVSRINGFADALVWEDTVVQVVDWISGMCSEWDTPLEECQEGVAWAMPRILAALSGYDRQWVNDFCGTWGAC